jgi:hypothetical protein
MNYETKLFCIKRTAAFDTPRKSMAICLMLKDAKFISIPLCKVVCEKSWQLLPT